MDGMWPFFNAVSFQMRAFIPQNIYFVQRKERDAKIKVASE